jgi:hypothetical protein
MSYRLRRFALLLREDKLSEGKLPGVAVSQPRRWSGTQQAFGAMAAMCKLDEPRLCGHVVE